jgi:hypothetical protein
MGSNSRREIALQNFRRNGSGWKSEVSKLFVRSSTSPAEWNQELTNLLPMPRWIEQADALKAPAFRLASEVLATVYTLLIQRCKLS